MKDDTDEERESSCRDALDDIQLETTIDESDFHDLSDVEVGNGRYADEEMETGYSEESSSDSEKEDKKDKKEGEDSEVTEVESDFCINHEKPLKLKEVIINYLFLISKIYLETRNVKIL